MVRIGLLQFIHAKSVGRSLTPLFARNALKYQSTKAIVTSESNSQVDLATAETKTSGRKKASAKLTNTFIK